MTESLQELTKALSNGDAAARAAAVAELGKLRDLRALPHLVMALSDPVAAVRRKAEEALQQTEQGRAMITFVEAVQASLASY